MILFFLAVNGVLFPWSSYENIPWIFYYVMMTIVLMKVVMENWEASYKLPDKSHVNPPNSDYIMICISITIASSSMLLAMVLYGNGYYAASVRVIILGGICLLVNCVVHRYGHIFVMLMCCIFQTIFVFYMFVLVNINDQTLLMMTMRPLMALVTNSHDNPNRLSHFAEKVFATFWMSWVVKAACTSNWGILCYVCVLICAAFICNFVEYTPFMYTSMCGLIAYPCETFMRWIFKVQGNLYFVCMCILCLTCVEYIICMFMGNLLSEQSVFVKTFQQSVPVNSNMNVTEPQEPSFLSDVYDAFWLTSTTMKKNSWFFPRFWSTSFWLRLVSTLKCLYYWDEMPRLFMTSVLYFANYILLPFLSKIESIQMLFAIVTPVAALILCKDLDKLVNLLVFIVNEDKVKRRESTKKVATKHTKDGKSVKKVTIKHGGEKRSTKKGQPKLEEE